MRYETQKYGKYWMVIDRNTYKHSCPWDYQGLVAVTLYKKGAVNTAELLNSYHKLNTKE